MLSLCHKIPEWFGLAGPLKLIQLQPPAMDRTISLWPRLLRARCPNHPEGRQEGVAEASTLLVLQWHTCCYGNQMMNIFLNLESVNRLLFLN